MIKIATLNVQGLNKPQKQKLMADDFIENKLFCLLIQETKIKKIDTINLYSSSNKKLILYNSGHNTKSEKGVGIVVEENTKLEFKAVSERICLAKIKANNKSIVVISAYSPTLDQTKKNPENTEKFYNDLTMTVQSSKSNMILIGGDFNARTKISDNIERQNYANILGAYARNTINQNGRYLIDFCKINKLKISNTFFKHKPSHQTTWKSPMKMAKDRKNQYRFQIDYILVGNLRGTKIKDTRSYNSYRTPTDHKPVVTEINLKRIYIKNQPREPSINVLQLKENQEAYRENIKGKLTLLENNHDIPIQEKWNKITELLKESAVEIVGRKTKNKTQGNETIKILSEKQKELMKKINIITNVERKHEVKKERNKILTQIHNEIKKEKKEKMFKTIDDLIVEPNDSRKMFSVVKNLKRMKPQKPLLIETKGGLSTSDEKEQANIIAEHFKKIFFKNAETYPKITPVPMSQPFTKEEVNEAVRSMKNGKSPGIDEVNVELIKYATQEIYSKIADIYN